MNVAYVTTFDPTNVLNWSGSGLNVARAVNGEEVVLSAAGPLQLNEAFGAKLRRRFYRYALRQWFHPERDPHAAKDYARQVDAYVRAHNSDCVLSLGTIPIGYSGFSRPTAIWSDATFPALLNFYPGYDHVARATIRAARLSEQRAFDHCSLALFTSEWAAESAERNYAVDRSKIRVVPFGANTEPKADDSAVRDLIRARQSQTCRLLFLGVEWDRKGGSLAWEVARRLNERGLAAELHVVGCEPPAQFAEAPWLVRHGFIRQDQPEELAKLHALFGSAHFLVLPARAECFGIVFAEASAFGVPSLATDVGGIPSVVRDGVNGYTFSVESGAEPYLETISRLLRDWESYRVVAEGARKEFQERLNWRVIGSQVRQLLREMVVNVKRDSRPAKI
ncbi:MAG: glycosyltransferase family 4 protein [Chthoniobacterales bacterium]